MPWLRKTLLPGLLTALIGWAGCHQNPSAPAKQDRNAGTFPIDATTTGAIKGVIRFNGAAPARIPIDMTLDPGCAMSKERNLSEGVIVNAGRLENVFVYVKDGLGNYIVPRPSGAVVVDQVGCRYRPHVVGMVTGQTLRVLNSDISEHNVHAVARNNPQWNESQMPKGAPREHVLNNPELGLMVTCNQHPWMRMYVNVVENPFFAVSDADGNFQISGLPPGRYTIEAVHEKLGAQQTKITIAARETGNLDFTFFPAP